MRTSKESWVKHSHKSSHYRVGWCSVERWMKVGITHLWDWLVAWDPTFLSIVSVWRTWHLIVYFRVRGCSAVKPIGSLGSRRMSGTPQTRRKAVTLETHRQGCLTWKVDAYPSRSTPSSPAMISDSELVLMVLDCCWRVNEFSTLVYLTHGVLITRVST